MKHHFFRAVIFDLDGVITKTASVHSAAWREMFNDYLRTRAKKYGEPFREFTHVNDYLPYIDGKLRYKGVESFLESRGINIPYGDPADDPGQETICGLGNKKNLFFNKVLKRDGVEVFESTITLIRLLKKEAIKIAVASSSRNCKAVLDRAGLLDLFDTMVDGEISDRLGLKGKPEPDIFTRACKNLECTPDNTVIIEDAVSGVQAGRNGGFGLIIGIAREGNSSDLKKNGADIIVEDIKDLGGIEKIDKWFKEKE
jgi:beta-phosphoglucomutase family hydrolase